MKDKGRDGERLSMRAGVYTHIRARDGLFLKHDMEHPLID